MLTANTHPRHQEYAALTELSPACEVYLTASQRECHTSQHALKLFAEVEFPAQPAEPSPQKHDMPSSSAPDRVSRPSSKAHLSLPLRQATKAAAADTPQAACIAVLSFVYQRTRGTQQ